MIIDNAIREHVSAQIKDWSGHDRDDTVGASEVGQCARKVFFEKHPDYVPDEDYVDGFGARYRGDIIEHHVWEPAMKHRFGDNLELSGANQRTLVDGYLSATPDGVLIGCSADMLKPYGIEKCSDEVLVECKSIDPRVDLDKEKTEHKIQTIIQMGIMRSATNYKPDVAIISYINASFFDDIAEFAVEFDQPLYDAMKHRARMIMTAETPEELQPEAKIAGGKMCKYCPYQGQCVGVSIGMIPQEQHVVPLQVVDTLEGLISIIDQDDAQIKRLTKQKGEYQERVKQILRDNSTQRIDQDGVLVHYTSVKGRKTYDIKAMAADGIDVERYAKEGNPSERLTLKIKADDQGARDQ